MFKNKVGKNHVLKKIKYMKERLFSGQEKFSKTGILLQHFKTRKNFKKKRKTKLTIYATLIYKHHKQNCNQQNKLKLLEVLKNNILCGIFC